MSLPPLQSDESVLYAKTAGKVARKPNRSSALRDGGLLRSPRGRRNVYRRVAISRLIGWLTRAGRIDAVSLTGSSTYTAFRRVAGGRKDLSQAGRVSGRCAPRRAVLFEPKPVLFRREAARSSRSSYGGSHAMRGWTPSRFFQPGFSRAPVFLNPMSIGFHFTHSTSDRSARTRLGAGRPLGRTRDIAWRYATVAAWIHRASLRPAWSRGRAIS